MSARWIFLGCGSSMRCVGFFISVDLAAKFGSALRAGELNAPGNGARISAQDDEDNSNNEGHWLPLASLDADWQEFLSLALVRAVFDPFRRLVNTFRRQSRAEFAAPVTKRQISSCASTSKQ